MNMKILVHIGFLYLLNRNIRQSRVLQNVQFILIVLVWTHIPKEFNKFIGNKKIRIIFRMQAYDSIMSGYFCIKFINYMLKGKTLLDYTNLFSPNDFKKNDRIIKRIFKNE